MREIGMFDADQTGIDDSTRQIHLHGAKAPPSMQARSFSSEDDEPDDLRHDPQRLQSLMTLEEALLDFASRGDNGSDWALLQLQEAIAHCSSEDAALVMDFLEKKERE